jgi:hypothetical protein
MTCRLLYARVQLTAPLLSRMETEVTLIIYAFTIRVFAYPWFYFSTTWSINILYLTTVEATAQAYWLAASFWLQGLQIKASLMAITHNIHRYVSPFPFLRVRVINFITQYCFSDTNQSFAYWPVMMTKICKSLKLWVVIWQRPTSDMLLYSMRSIWKCSNL